MTGNEGPVLGREQAMKALAARRRDIDLRVLIDLLGLTSDEQVVALCVRVFPDEALPDRARLIGTDLFEGTR